MKNLEIKETTKENFFAEVDKQQERDPMPQSSEITFFKKDNVLTSSQTIWRFKDNTFFGVITRDHRNFISKYYLAK